MNPNAIVRIAFMTAPFLYATVAWLVGQNQPEPTMDPAQIRLFFVVLAAAYLLVVLLEPLITGPSMRRYGRYEKNTMIVRLAIYESGAIFGLLLTFLSRDMKYVLGFGLAAICFMLLKAPAPPLD